MKTTSLATGAVLALTVAACSQPAEKAAPAEAPAAATATPASANIWPFRIGQLEAVVLRDGQLTIPNDNKALGVGQTPEAVAAVLTAAGLPGDSLTLSINPLLIRDGDRIVLIDTGTGGQMGAGGGLMTALTEAGVQPGQVTDILISHSHGDHVGGLVTKDGALAFPNATIRMSEAEWRFAKSYAPAAALVKTITPRVQTFAPGAVVAPNITSLSIPGHTPGHVGYEIVSGTDRLLYIGDAMHNSVVSVQRPEWTNAWDEDGAAGIASRQGLLERAASQNLRLYAVHFPFPGVGRIQRRDDGFVWAPEH